MPAISIRSPADPKDNLIHGGLEQIPFFQDADSFGIGYAVRLLVPFVPFAAACPCVHDAGLFGWSCCRKCYGEDPSFQLAFRSHNELLPFYGWLCLAVFT